MRNFRIFQPGEYEELHTPKSHWYDVGSVVKFVRDLSEEPFTLQVRIA